MMCSWRVEGRQSAPARALRVCVLSLVLSISAFGNVWAVEGGQDSTEPRNPWTGIRRGIGIRVGATYGFLSGIWLRPGESSFGGDVGLMLPISRKFEARLMATMSSIRDSEYDLQEKDFEPTGDEAVDLSQWMILLVGYADNNWLRRGESTPYMHLGFGLVRKVESKFAVQVGVGNLFMCGPGFGIDLGLDLNGIAADSNGDYKSSGWATILEFKAALVVRPF